MKRLKLKNSRHARRIKSVTKAIRPKSDRLRLVINRSNKNLRAQIVDDKKNATICYAGTDEKTFGGSSKNKEAAKKLGEMIAKRAIDKGVKKVYLDRRGVLYHGKIAEFANSAREHGLEF